jgi:hypothetical protein
MCPKKNIFTTVDLGVASKASATAIPSTECFQIYLLVNSGMHTSFQDILRHLGNPIVYGDLSGSSRTKQASAEAGASSLSFIRDYPSSSRDSR